MPLRAGVYWNVPGISGLKSYKTGALNAEIATLAEQLEQVGKVRAAFLRLIEDPVRTLGSDRASHHVEFQHLLVVFSQSEPRFDEMALNT